jgi:hypothetical protein
MPTPILGVYFIVKSLKKSSSRPNNNRGMTHQSDEKQLNDMSEYFVGVVNRNTPSGAYMHQFINRAL